MKKNGDFCGRNLQAQLIPSKGNMKFWYYSKVGQFGRKYFFSFKWQRSSFPHSGATTLHTCLKTYKMLFVFRFPYPFFPVFCNLSLCLNFLLLPSKCYTPCLLVLADPVNKTHTCYELNSKLIFLLIRKSFLSFHVVDESK